MSYTAAQSGGHSRGNRPMGWFTLVNHGGAPVSGWRLQAALPDDRVRWVSTSVRGWPGYQDWSQTPGGVVITGPHPGEAIPARGSMVFYISGWGPATSPASCSFNGSAC